MKMLNYFFTRNNIKYVFGNPGTTELPLLEVMQENDITQYILALHESSVIGIASGYAVSTKQTAVVNVHTYPGVANSLGNLYTAYSLNTPLLILAGNQRTNVLVNKPVLYGDLVNLSTTAVKFAAQVERESDFWFLLNKAYLLSQSNLPGPTLLSIPLDLWTTDIKNNREVKYSGASGFEMVESEDIKQFIKLWTSSKNPAIVVDTEAARDDAYEQIQTFVQLTSGSVYRAPFANGKIIDARYPSFKGKLPLSEVGTKKALHDHDLIVVCGQNLKILLYKNDNNLKDLFNPDVKVVQIASQFGDNSISFLADWYIEANLKGFFSELIKELNVSPEMLKPGALAKGNPEQLLPSKPWTPLEKIVYFALSQLDPTHTGVVVEGSTIAEAAHQFAQGLGFSHLYGPPQGGGLGWAMPFTIGVALGLQSPAVCFIGDGCSLFSIQSLWTAAHYHIPAIFICNTNHEYKVLKSFLKRSGSPITNKILSSLNLSEPDLDFADITAGFGAKVIKIKAPEEITAAVKAALDHKGPTFIIYDEKQDNSLA